MIVGRFSCCAFTLKTANTEKRLTLRRASTASRRYYKGAEAAVARRLGLERCAIRMRYRLRGETPPF